MKKCIKCNKDKNLIDFYRHKKMADGHINKCIDCSKIGFRDNYKKYRENPDFIEKEMARGREKYYRLNYKEKHKKDSVSKSIIITNYHNKYPEKRAARNKSTTLSPKIKGNHLHHWNYNVGYEKDVIELTLKQHYTAHRFLIYDQEKKLYRRKDDNTILDNKENHYNYIILVNL
jgi:hypothetical protein